MIDKPHWSMEDPSMTLASNRAQTSVAAAGGVGAFADSGTWGEIAPQGSEGDADGAASTPEGKRRLEAMFRSYHEMIWRTLRRLGAEPDAASDAVQQAYLIAAERLPQVRVGSERAFLFSTAITLHRTKRRREQRCQLEGDMDMQHHQPTQHEQFSRRAYARQLLDEVLGKMSPDLVTVFALFELEGLTSVEISELLDIPLGTAASRLRRAREAFRLGAQQLELTGKGKLP